ncbi:hypothetical protein E2N92_03755 [Methanofollis formosanus]|uniref:Uncharacterized protein n=1 Tax=Methanofollis formosanus TaxID=299308 RepID=A0A8G1EG67_9EURY|nr:hypothetical protein [Methanofollis formosanus]QYZ78602.1 hypothetical protein E2N92_03755 [Methanofollis formosanus]
MFIVYAGARGSCLVTLKMILTILSSGLHERLNSPYPVEANTKSIDNSSDGSAAPNRRDFPAISRRGEIPRPPPTTKIAGWGGMMLDFDSLLERTDEDHESIQFWDDIFIRYA